MAGENKRIYDLDPNVDTQGKGLMVDAVGDDEATYSPVRYHVVDTLPLTPTVSWIYYLTATDGLAPTGVYTYDTEWVCISQFETLPLSDWSGVVSVEFISGVSYSVSVVGEVTSLTLTMNNDGVCRLKIDNPTEFIIAEPTNVFSMGEFGLDAISKPSVRLSLQRDTLLSTTEYECITSERISNTVLLPA